jgi:hypothetical protein
MLGLQVNDDLERIGTEAVAVAVARQRTIKDFPEETRGKP